MINLSLQHNVPGYQTQFVKVVGSNKVNYYKQYEFKVQATNNYGSGPNSSVAFVFSAEGSKFKILSIFYHEKANNLKSKSTFTVLRLAE